MTTSNEPLARQPADADRPAWHRRARFVWQEWIKPLVFVVAICATFRSAVADWNIVPSGSMRPTIVEGDRILVNKLAYGLRVPLVGWWVAQWSEPQRGEIVVLFEPTTGVRLVKRVIGIPGDRIVVRGGVLLINGEAAEYAPLTSEQFEAVNPEDRAGHALYAEKLGDTQHELMWTFGGQRSPDFGPTTVPAEHFFLMGDCRDESRDSRVFGSVHRRQIVGRTGRVILSVDPDRGWLPRFNRFWHPLH